MLLNDFIREIFIICTALRKHPILFYLRLTVKQFTRRANQEDEVIVHVILKATFMINEMFL